MEQRGGRQRGPRGPQRDGQSDPQGPTESHSSLSSWSQGDEGDGTGLNGLILLLLSARSETAEAGGSGAGRSLARSLQKAEAALRSCVRPGLRRLLPPRPRQRDGSDPDGDDEEEAEGTGLVSALEQSFPGLQRVLCVREDPRTETFHGHVRPQPDADAFSFHAVHPVVAQRGASLHALLQHRHLLRLARAYSRRLHASSAFLRRLPALRAQPALQGLCRELRAHAGHWAALRRRLRGDPWLRPLVLRRHEAVAGMRRELLLLARHATRLTERHIEERLRALARAGSTVPLALLADLCQGLELYNQTVAELAPELHDAGIADGCGAFPVCRVLAVLAAERGRVAAERLWPLLQPQDTSAGAEHVCWEDIAVPWPPECAAAEGSGTAEHEEAAGIAVALQALCREDEELLGLLLRALAGSTDGLRHHGTCRHTHETVAAETLDVPGIGWKSSPALDSLHTHAALLAGYHPSLWAAAGTALEQRLAAPHAGTAGTAARGLARALAHARVPLECHQELRWLCQRLLCHDALRAWERGFPGALGAARWGSVLRAQPEATLSEAARRLQRLHPALSCALRCLHGCPTLRVPVLSRCVASAQAASSWLRGSACRFLAAWALPPFLLVTQGDLPVLQAEAERLVMLLGELSGSPTEPERGAPQLPHTCPPRAPQLPHTLPPLFTPLRPHALTLPAPQLPHTLPPLSTPQLPHTSPPRPAPLRPHTSPPSPQPPHTLPPPAPLRPHTSPPSPQLPHTSPPHSPQLPHTSPPHSPQLPHTSLPPPLTHWELELCQQIRSLAASIQLFSGEVLRLFSSDCKRVAAEIFQQTMPQGRHWRLGPRAEPPSSPSAYAAAAAQAVLGQVVQGARALPRDAQAPTLARVATAFLEAWMDHILAHRIKFSLQGALQLRRDLDAVRELLGSERSGLAPETRRDLLSLRALRQMEAAIVCLLQQPGSPAAGPRAWSTLRRCCSDDSTHPQDPVTGSLRGLDALEPPSASPGAEVPPRFLAPGAEPYVLGSRQQWLSLRLHRAPPLARARAALRGPQPRPVTAGQ